MPESSHLTPITDDVISFLVEATCTNAEMKTCVRDAASSHPDGEKIKANFLIAMANADEDRGVPMFHRLVVMKSLMMHVDWREVANFFADDEQFTGNHNPEQES